MISTEGRSNRNWAHFIPPPPPPPPPPPENKQTKQANKVPFLYIQDRNPLLIPSSPEQAALDSLVIAIDVRCLGCQLGLGSLALHGDSWLLLELISDYGSRSFITSPRLLHASFWVQPRCQQDQTMFAASAKVKERQRFLQVRMPEDESIVKFNPSSSLLIQCVVQLCFIPQWFLRVSSLVQSRFKLCFVQKIGCVFLEVTGDR